MKFLKCKIRLTQDKKHCIIESVIIFEPSHVQNGSEEFIVPTETIAFEEIQKLYEQIGIKETTQQTSQSTELNLENSNPVPTLYTPVSLVYSDSVSL